MSRPNRNARLMRSEYFKPPYKEFRGREASYAHEPPHQVVGVGVIVFGGELRGVELRGPQDLQHPIQGLGHRHRAALLRRVDDVYHLPRRKKTRDWTLDLIPEVWSKYL